MAGDITVSFDSDEPLRVIEVAVTGQITDTLVRSDFTESGAYSYSHEMTGLGDGTYNFELTQAEDYAGNAATVGQTDSVVLDTTAPDAPVLSNLVAGDEVVDFDVTLADEDEVELHIYRDTAPTATTLLETVDVSGDSGTIPYTDDSPPTNGVTYYYRGRLEDAAGNLSSYSNEVSGTPASSGPANVAFWRVDSAAPFYTCSLADLLAGNAGANAVSRATPGFGGTGNMFHSDGKLYFVAASSATIKVYLPDGTAQSDVVLPNTVLAGATVARRASDGRIFYERAAFTDGIMYRSDPPYSVESVLINNAHGFDDNASAMTFDDAGNRVLFWGQSDNEAWHIAPDGSSATLLGSAAPVIYSSLRYDPTKNSMVTLGTSSTIRIADLTAGSVSTVTPSTAPGSRSVLPIGESNYLIFVNSGTLYRCDWDGSNVTSLGASPTGSGNIVMDRF